MGQSGSNVHWSDEQIGALKSLYEDHSNEYLSEFVFNGSLYPDRTKNAIKHKARRVGLEKDDSFRVESIVGGVDDPDFGDQSFNDFICGFVAGEGSFSTNKSKDRNRYVFSISLADVDAEILHKIEDYLGVGNVYEYDSREEHWEDTAQYQVQCADEIYNVIIPFFEENNLRDTHKQEQYIEWRDGFLEYFDLTERFKCL
jgi:hypothetical protein